MKILQSTSSDETEILKRIVEINEVCKRKKIRCDLIDGELVVRNMIFNNTVDALEYVNSLGLRLVK